MSQITIRNLPPAVEQRLRGEATRTATSVNKTVIRLLCQATGLQPASGPKRDLSDLAGRWTAEQAAEFERAVQLFEKVDEELWR